MRLEAPPGQEIGRASIGLTRDEALSLPGNLSNWQASAPLEGDWALALSDGEHEVTLRVTNHPSDQQFAGRSVGPS